MDASVVGGVVLRAIVAYAAVIVYVRVSGNRTLGKMRAFDFVVTIALGTLLASTIVSESVALWEGLLAMAALIALQWIVARVSVHSRVFDRLVTNESIVLYRGSSFDEAAMRKARVTHAELRSAMRTAGIAAEERVREIRLETNGELSVVRLD